MRFKDLNKEQIEKKVGNALGEKFEEIFCPDHMPCLGVLLDEDYHEGPVLVVVVNKLKEEYVHMYDCSCCAEHEDQVESIELPFLFEGVVNAYPTVDSFASMFVDAFEEIA